MKAWIAFLMLILIGGTARLYTASLDSTFDMESYRIVYDIMDIDGGNVYAETDRYNYGMPWAFILHIIGNVTQSLPDAPSAFRMGIALLLTIVDSFIAFILWKRFRLLAAILFFLNPISILVTGTHSQFENLAVVWGMVAALIWEHDENSQRLRWFHIAALVFLGLSLSIKHVLFAFPLWLAVKQPTWSRKIFVLVVPLALFFAAFIPFWHPDIVKQVFLYQSFRNTPFLHYVLPGALFDALSFNETTRWVVGWLLFLTALFLGALAFKRWRPTQALLMYMLILTIFTPAMANQYAAICVAALAVFVNPFFILYSLLMGWHMLHDAPNLFNMLSVPPITRDLRDWLVIILWSGFIWHFYSHSLRLWCMRQLQWIETALMDQFPSLPLSRQRLVVRVALMGVLLVGSVAITMSVRQTSTASQEVVAISGIYGEQIALQGVSYYRTDYTPNGSLILDLQWQILEIPDEDYAVAFAFFNTRTGQIEQSQVVPFMNGIQMVSDTAIFTERYTLRLPDTDLTETYVIFASIYDMNRKQDIPLRNASTDQRGETLRIGAVQVRPPFPRVVESTLALWDERLALYDYRCLIDHGNLIVNLDWQLQARFPYDTRLFIHAFDENENRVAQFDGRLSELHPLDGLPPLARLQTTTHFEAITTQTTLRIGFYRPNNQERIPVTSLVPDIPFADQLIEIICYL